MTERQQANAIARVCPIQTLVSKEENVLTGYTLARIVTIKGQIWQRPFSLFGLTNETVIVNWNHQQEIGTTDWEKVIQ